MTLEMVRLLGLWGGGVAAVAYLVMAYAFFATGQWQIGGAYVAYAVSNVLLALLLL